MIEMTKSLSDSDRKELLAEIARLNKIITALMNRAERAMSVQGSDFGLFQTAVLLEEEVHRRTRELKSALQENERINRALQSAQARMQEEIIERSRAEEALRQANQRLEMLSTTDPLTGLANRRHFSDMLDKEWRRAIRTHGAIGLAMIDIDLFKKFNDRYGHLAGDDCLRKVATVLNQTVRSTDLAARYGGEEFILVLPDTDFEKAQCVAERVRLAVSNLKVPHEANMDGIVTISIGVTSTVPIPDSFPEQSIDLADSALYMAKQQGRNRIMGRYQGNRSPG